MLAASALRALALLTLLVQLHGGARPGQPTRTVRAHGSGRLRQRLPYRAPPHAAPSSVLAGELPANVGARRAPSTNAAAARQITNRLARAGSAAEIMRVFEEGGSSCNEINLCAVWNQLGKARLSRREREAFFREHDANLRTLQRRTEEVLSRLTPRNLAGVPYGIARLGYVPAHETMRRVAAEAAPRLDEFNSQELSNTMLAFATAGVHVPDFFERVAQAAGSAERIRTFNEQELANTAWAFAKLNVSAPALFDAIAVEAEPRLRTFIAQGLANTAWAFATASVPADALFEGIAAEASDRVGEFKEQELSSLAWAFATAGVTSTRLFDAIAHQAFTRIGLFTTQGLANLVWAFAKAGVPAEALFGAVAREATGGATLAGEKRSSRLPRFTTQELASTAFAFARAEVRDTRLSNAIASESLRRIRTFNEQELANTAWAFAVTGVARLDLFEAVASALMQKTERLTSQGLTHTLLAFAKAGWPLRDRRPLRDRLAAEAEWRAATFTPQELASVAWSWAVSDFLPPTLVRALSASVSVLGPDRFVLEERSMLHQFFVSVALQGRAKWLPPLLMLSACREAVVMQVPQHSSQLHTDVSNVLARLGIDHVNELCVPSLGYHVDIAIMGLAQIAPGAGGAGAGAGGGGGGGAEGARELGGARVVTTASLGSAGEAAAAALTWPAEGDAAHEYATLVGAPAVTESTTFVAGEPTDGAFAQLLGAAAVRTRTAVSRATTVCKGLVIEVNGPSHYDLVRKLRPESRLKCTHLALDGWAVLELPWWEWAAVHGGTQKKAVYLTSLLTSAAERIVQRTEDACAAEESAAAGANAADRASEDASAPHAPDGPVGPDTATPDCARKAASARGAATWRAQPRPAASPAPRVGPSATEAHVARTPEADAPTAGAALSARSAPQGRARAVPTVQAAAVPARERAKRRAAPDAGEAAALAGSERALAQLVLRVHGFSERRAAALREHLGGREPYGLPWEELVCTGVGQHLAKQLAHELAQAAGERTSPEPPVISARPTGSALRGWDE
ncbi:hypothetical protein KFE25_012554 [Diacronema lutheri]|uniref:RAP domain-containing protein n=4 Tax=Diacronema lutheri TaxID=2081491 RepID=A0A8J5XAW1_DIALT|nr:hypothetical protein KFE25_012554 [Diacronema lutheri]